MARRNTAEKLLADNPGLSARDMRDLLIEYEVDAATASDLTAGRLAAETGR